MINLYIPTNTDYTNNGDATLMPVSCLIKQTINGAWQLTMELPYDKEGRYKKICQGAVLRVTNYTAVAEIGTTQLFRIYDYKRNTKSMTVIAFPKAMESTFDAPISQIIIDSDVTGASAAATLNGVSNKYTVQSDLTATGRAVWTNTNLNKAIAGTDENAFINAWGGEVVYDNHTIKILEQIGDDTNPQSVLYGKNINEISYEVDESGLFTRIYPLSTDGIRYNDDGTEYIDSPKISDYPYVHSGYFTTPYKLVEDDPASVSRTAQKTADIKTRITTLASTLSHSIWNTAVSNGWKIEYLASIYRDIIANIQEMVTANYTHTDFIKAVNSAVLAGMSWMGEQEDPEWHWIEVQTDAWKYGNETSGRYARNEWQYIDKKWRWFGDDYYWQQPKDDDSTWTWYENTDTHKKRYGTQDRYYLKGQYIYITEDGTLKKYWLDGDGWYDSDKTDESDWDWHESSTAAGAWWFGDEEGDNYMSGQWAFIDGTLYWFDDNGYYYGVKEEHPPFDWCQSGEAFWFGDPEPDPETGLKIRSYWLASQWAKIDRQWYKFDSSGYTEDIHTQALTLFHNGMTSLTTLVQTCNGEAYDLLFDLMEEWTENKYAQGADIPAVTINVDMVDLSKTIDYKDYQNLEKIRLGDTVRCIDYVHAIASVERVVELTYDVMRGFNTAITIGVANSTVGSILSGSSGSSSGGGYNSAINVEVIEQNISQKNPTLVQGKNVTLTNNVDGTQTIDVDEIIRQGDNVTVTHNSDGSYTVSAEGGALEYWEETSTDLSRRVNGSVQNQWGWICDNDYLVEADDTNDNWQLLTANQATWGYFNFFRAMDSGTRCCVGICRVKNDNKWRFAVIMMSGQNVKMGHQYYSGDFRVEAFTYNGVTLYYSIGFMGVDSYDAREHEWSELLNQTGTKTLLDFGTYESVSDALAGLITTAHFYSAQVNYTGESIGEYSAWGGEVFLVGNPSSIDKDDMPWYITKNGVFEGTNYKLNGTPLDEIFQKILSAGTNIQIAQDGKTISATDTTYSAGTNIQISNQNVISATDTDELAELVDVDIDDSTLANGQVLKYNATSEKWENGTGGGGTGSLNAEEMTSVEYNLLPTADKEDPDVIHFINDTSGGDVEVPIDMTSFTNKVENSSAMSVSVVNDELVYRYTNGYVQIGAQSVRAVAVPATVTKIKYKITTGANCYSTGNPAWYVTIGVKASTTSNWIYGNDADWLVKASYNALNTEYEGELDLSSITSDCYLMVVAHGWTVTFNEITLVEEQPATGSTLIKYKDITYGEQPPFKVINGQLCIKYKKEVTT